jgi:hypothetical protein
VSAAVIERPKTLAVTRKAEEALGVAVRLYSILFGTWAIKFTPHSLLLI